MSVTAGVHDALAGDLAALERDGYLVIENLLTEAELAATRAALAPLLAQTPEGRNEFEGLSTRRIYTLVARGKPFEAITEHPRILAICDALLQPNYLLTASQAIHIQPGETPQGYHTDDSFYPIPRPRKPISLATIWAIDAFTAENGATEILPGSHEWPDQRVWDQLQRIDFETKSAEERERLIAEGNAPEPSSAELGVAPMPVEMPAGSVIVFSGMLVHRGGANHSRAPRTAVSNQYCEPWARQQENFMMATPREVAAAMSDRLQALLGYSIHPPFMGHTTGIHPVRALKKSGEGNGSIP